MPRTTSKPTPRAQAAQQPPACPNLPSVAALGRYAAQIRERVNQHDEARTVAKKYTPAYHAAEAAYYASHAEEEAVRALIATRPIATLEDVVALAWEGFVQAEARGIDAVEAAFARIAIAVADVAAVPLTEFTNAYGIGLLRRSAGAEALS